MALDKAPSLQRPAGNAAAGCDRQIVIAAVNAYFWLIMNVEDLYRLLRAGHIQAQGIVDTVTNPLLVLDASLCVQNASRSFFETFKVDRYETIGQHIYELGNRQWDIPELRLLLMEVIPNSTAVIDYEVRHDFPGLGPRTMLLTARKLFHPDNSSHSLLLSIVDVTERYHRDDAKDVLIRELRHRTKNLLAVLESIARLTTVQGVSAEEFREAFLGRLSALVEAQELAFVEQNETDVGALIQRLLAPYITRPEALVLKPGAAVKLDAQTIQGLSLVLHELATNAAKYGALCEPDGQVQISWQVEETSRLRLNWVEIGGPPVTPPVATGYGTELIKFATTYSLGGHANQEYAASGLKAEIIIPLRNATVAR